MQIRHLFRWTMPLRARTRRRFLVCFPATADVLEQRALLTAGALDPTFGSGGLVETGFENSEALSTSANTTALQSDGKIVAAGEGAIARYLPDGALDLTFGVQGKVAFPWNARSVATQADGKIVVAGSMDNSTSQDFVVARYLSNGTLDTTFDGDGFVTTDFGSAFETAYSVAIQANGRIVVAGGSSDSVAVARYNTDGSLDTTFDGDGRFLRKFNTNRSDTAYSVAIQANGRIVIAGASWVNYSFNSSHRDIFIARLNAGGTLDHSFDGDGYLSTDVSGGYNFRTAGAGDIAIQADGTLVVSGSARFNFTDYLVTARYNVNGSPDTGYDGDGFRLTNIGTTGTNQGAGSAVAVQSDGRILTIARGEIHRFNTNGSVDTTFDYDGRAAFNGDLRSLLVQASGRIVAGGRAFGYFALVGIGSTGQRDTGFSGDSLVTTSFGPSIDEAAGSALQSNGRIVVVGTSSRQFALTRYNTNGSLDTIFSGDGRTVIDFGAEFYESQAVDVAIQSDGKILVAGAVRRLTGTYVSSLFGVARLNIDGTLDTTFSGDGLVTTDIGGYAVVSSMALQTDGRIVLAGSGASGSAIVRYNSSGTLDTSFSGDGIVMLATQNQTRFSSVAIRPDGKILAAGEIFPSTVGRYDSTLFLAQFNANGTFDTSFGGNGRVVDSVNRQRTGQDIALLSDGSFLVAGSAAYRQQGSSYSDMAITKYNSNGTPDIAFGTAGTLVRTFDRVYSFSDFNRYAVQSTGSSVLVQPNGKIVLGGTAGGQFAIVRFNSNGTTDTSFAGDGQLTTDFGPESSSLVNLLQQSNGRFIAAGSRRIPFQTTYESDFVVSRYLEVNEPPVATSIRVNAQNQIEIADLWGRDDKLQIQRVNDSLIVTDTTSDPRALIEVTGVPGVIGSGTKQVTIPYSSIDATGKPLLILGNQGDDTVELLGNETVDASTKLLFKGGAGFDILKSNGVTLKTVWKISTAGRGSLRGSDQNVITEFGVDFIGVEDFVGGQASDVFIISLSAVPVDIRLDGGLSDDRIRVCADADMVLGSQSFIVGENRFTATRSGVSHFVKMRGIEAADLYGGTSNNLLDATWFSGVASIWGQGGNDDLRGGSGNDFIVGGPGDDLIFGGYGNDSLHGNDGNDLVNGGSGDDYLYGDDGNDILVGGYGADVLDGNQGEDIVIGGIVTVLESTSVPGQRSAITTAWFSASPFSDRVTLLRDTGVDGELKLTPRVSVYDDFDVDTLTGNDGTDWFFASGSTTIGEIGRPSGGLLDLGMDEVLNVL